MLPTASGRAANLSLSGETEVQPAQLRGIETKGCEGNGTANHSRTSTAPHRINRHGIRRVRISEAFSSNAANKPGIQVGSSCIWGNPKRYSAFDQCGNTPGVFKEGGGGGSGGAGGGSASVMAWRSNHHAVYPDLSIPFSAATASSPCPCPPPSSLSSCSSAAAAAANTGRGSSYRPPPIPPPPAVRPSPQTLTFATSAAEVPSAALPIPIPVPPAAGAAAPSLTSASAWSRKVDDTIAAIPSPAQHWTNETRLGWLDGMKAQSPPRFETPMGDDIFDSDAQEAAATSQYATWMERHPSALDTFEELMEGAAGKRIAVFLDYDGTLSPIVEDPDRAFMSDLMRATVKEVATHFPTAIISGRGRQKVYDFVQLAELYYAGSHGMDIMGPAEGCNGFKAKGTRSKDKKGNDVVLFQPSSKFLPMMNEVCKILEEKANAVPGARVEHNKYCVTLHFRRVKEESWNQLAEHAECILKDYPELQLTLGRKVLEIRPAIEWDKGKAVEFLLKALGLENSSDVLPVYIGDDRTDEDAFEALNERGNGCSILVSTVAKNTKALYSLRDPSEVMEFLQSLVRWRVGHPMDWDWADSVSNDHIS